MVAAIGDVPGSYEGSRMIAPVTPAQGTYGHVESYLTTPPPEGLPDVESAGVPAEGVVGQRGVRRRVRAIDTDDVHMSNL